MSMYSPRGVTRPCCDRADRARAGESGRGAWLALAAFVSGTGIWSTHFVAMLAYQPHLPIGYDPGLTLLSILAAMAIGGVGWWLSLRPERWAALAAAR